LDLHVKSVGDGACAAVIDSRTGHGVMLIDGGSTRGKRVAGGAVERALHRSEGDLAIVITHLHQDHFNGLIDCAERGLVIADDPVLVQPRLPRGLASGPFLERFFALDIALGEASGVPDVDFAAALERMSIGPVWRKPVSKGEWFRAGHEDFEVFWPPRTLTPEVAGTVRKAVAAYDDLAQRDPVLRRRLDQVRESGVAERWAAEDGAYDGPPPDVGPEATPVDARSDEAASAIDISGDAEAGLFLHSTPSTHRRPDYDPDVRNDVIEAARLFREAANDMSLVFASEDRTFIAFGDVSPKVAESAATAISGTDCECDRPARIVLAPHHGSHGPLPARLGNPEFCISQNGDRLHGLWHRNHRDCPARSCVTTHGGAIRLPGEHVRYANDT
jgi:hypothetical protein